MTGPFRCLRAEGKGRYRCELETYRKKRRLEISEVAAVPSRNCLDGHRPKSEFGMGNVVENHDLG
jgi:hypothetical protein